MRENRSLHATSPRLTAAAVLALVVTAGVNVSGVRGLSAAFGPSGASGPPAAPGLSAAFGPSGASGPPAAAAARPGDFADVPVSIAASAAGDVWVSFDTDTVDPVIRHYTADMYLRGEHRLSWSDGRPAYVADGPGTGVFVAQRSSESDAGTVFHLDDAGRRGTDWTVTDLLPNIAVREGRVGALQPAVSVLAEDADGTRRVRVFDQTGLGVATFVVDQTSYDLAASSGASAFGGMVTWVVDRSLRPPGTGGETWIVRYDATLAMGRWMLSADVQGIDEGSGGGLWLAESPFDGSPPHAVMHGTDGTILRTCPLAGRPRDLAVGIDGSVYVIVHTAETGLEGWSVVRLGADCAPLGSWGQAELPFRPTPTGGPPTTPPSTPTSTPPATPPTTAPPSTPGTPTTGPGTTTPPATAPPTELPTGAATGTRPTALPTATVPQTPAALSIVVYLPTTLNGPTSR